MSDLPNIDRDRLQGFRRMAGHVLDDMLEAALDAASRHEHQVDALKARVAELEAQVAKAAGENAPQFFGLTVADLAEVLKEEGEGEDNAAVKQCLVLDDGDIVVADTIRELCHAVRYLTLASQQALDINAELQAKVEKKRGAAQLAAIPMEQGPFVITMKTPHGRRFWGVISPDEYGWTTKIGSATCYETRADAEQRKPRRSAVVTLADAHELVLAEKVLSITPPADAPTGPEAA